MNDLARMAEKAAELKGGPIRAYSKPAEALANRPCLLVLPPSEEPADGTAGGHSGWSWRFALLSKHAAGSYDSVAELAPLAEEVRDRLDFDTRRYESFALPTSTGSVNVTACVFTYFEIA